MTSAGGSLFAGVSQLEKSSVMGLIAPMKNDSENNKSLSHREKFFLISGVIGLIVDLIALITFITGLWNFNIRQDSTSETPSSIFFVITGLLMLYGWIVLTWTLTRRGINHISEKWERQKALTRAIFYSSLGLGVFLFPLFSFWLIAVSTTDHTTNVWDYVNLERGIISFIAINISIKFLMQMSYEDLMSSEDFIPSAIEKSKIRKRSKEFETSMAVLKADVEKDWQKWEAKIDIELNRNTWVDVENLSDMAGSLDIPAECLEYVLAKYASIHPKKVKYGYLRHRSFITEFLRSLGSERTKVLIKDSPLTSERLWNISVPYTPSS